MLEAWELVQRQKGNTAGAEMARVLRDQYGDIHFPSAAAIDNAQAFSDEARQALGKEGHVFYLLSGQSIKSLRAAGKSFWSDWHKDYPDFEALPSSITEVAINPDPKKFFLPKSNNKPLAEQERMVAQYTNELKERMRIKDADVVMGEVSDYVELAFSHLDKTGERLFGEKYDYRYTRTKTRVGSHVAHVGHFDVDAGDGLDVHSWLPGSSFDGVWVAPLVVPTRNR